MLSYRGGLLHLNLNLITTRRGSTSSKKPETGLVPAKPMRRSKGWRTCDGLSRSRCSKRAEGKLSAKRLQTLANIGLFPDVAPEVDAGGSDGSDTVDVESADADAEAGADDIKVQDSSSCRRRSSGDVNMLAWESDAADVATEADGEASS